MLYMVLQLQEALDALKNGTSGGYGFRTYEEALRYKQHLATTKGITTVVIVLDASERNLHFGGYVDGHVDAMWYAEYSPYFAYPVDETGKVMQNPFSIEWDKEE